MGGYLKSFYLKNSKEDLVEIERIRSSFPSFKFRFISPYSIISLLNLSVINNKYLKIETQFEIEKIHKKENSIEPIPIKMPRIQKFDRAAFVLLNEDISNSVYDILSNYSLFVENSINEPPKIVFLSYSNENTLSNLIKIKNKFYETQSWKKYDKLEIFHNSYKPAPLGGVIISFPSFLINKKYIHRTNFFREKIKKTKKNKLEEIIELN